MSKKIKVILLKIKKFKDEVTVLSDENLSRSEYRRKYNLENGFNCKLTAKEIIRKKIPIKIIDCTGLVKLFSYYSQKIDLDCDIIFTANKNDIEKVNSYKIRRYL